MEDNLNGHLSRMPAAMQSWHRGRMKADMCCRRAWLISSKSICPIRVANSIVSAFCPALAVPLQAHTPAPGYPAPQTRHPPGEALLGLVGLSLLVPTHKPGGLELPRQRGGQSWRGKELASARKVAPLPCPPVLSLSALRCLSVPRPLPAARRPGGAARCGKQLSLRCGSRGDGTEKRHLHPYIRIPHLQPASPPAPLTPQPLPERALAPAGTGRTRGLAAAAEGGGSRPAAPRSPAPGTSGLRRGSGRRGLLAGAGAVTGLGR